MTNVYLLHHTYGPAESETYKLVGVFRSQTSAQEAMQRALMLPGFKDYPDGFTIDRYVLDKACWTEGFGLADGAIMDRES